MILSQFDQNKVKQRLLEKMFTQKNDIKTVDSKISKRKTELARQEADKILEYMLPEDGEVFEEFVQEIKCYICF